MDRAPAKFWALLQEDEETRETYYLSVLSGLNHENDWMHEWVDDLDSALLLEWSQMVALACSLRTGRSCEVVPVQDEEDE